MYTKFGGILPIHSQNSQPNHNSDINQGPLLPCKFLKKLTSNNANLDLVNFNICAEFGQILSTCTQDIEREQNSVINQGPNLLQICKT